MKLQLEVIHVDTTKNCVVFKPINCSLQGDLVYKDLPRRAVEQFKKGQTVEATIPLPDHYPVTDLVEQWYAHQEELRRTIYDAVETVEKRALDRIR